MSVRLQLAVDNPDLVSALGPVNKAVNDVDIIEVGTILVIGEGLRAVREVRALYPEKTILADVRIAEAGAIISRQCYEAGADWVSCVAGASLTTIKQVVEVAQEFGGQVQVELGETYSKELAQQWREIGVHHVIVKRSRDNEAAGNLTWSDDALDRINELHEMGFMVTVTGGISLQDLPVFENSPIDIVIVGRSIVKADNPQAAAAEFHQAVGNLNP